MSKYAPLAEVIRNDFVESVHYGSLAVSRESWHTWGNVDEDIFPRSATKPLQAATMVSLGLELPDRLLALVAASHSGSASHQAGALEILATVGLGVEALQCPFDRPYGDSERRAFGANPKAREVHNCSGKHAGMIATSKINGWDIETYRDPEHPLQQAIKSNYQELTGVTSRFTAVDGCGAPIFSTSVRGLAKASASLGLGTTESLAEVSRAMRSHPEMVAGEGRFTTEAMRVIPGLILKEGAEGVEIGVLPDGTSFAFKVIDGSMRALPVIVAAALEFVGVTSAPLQQLAKSEVLGGGNVVGEIRSILNQS